MRDKFLRWGLLLFVFLIPFGTKKFLFDFPTPFRNFYTSEYSSAFLYAGDVLLLVLLVLFLFSKPLLLWRERFKDLKLPMVFLSVFLFVSLLSVAFAAYPSFSIYSFGRLLVAILSALMIGAALKSDILRFKGIAVALSLAAVFESVVGFFQFVLNKSVGLRFLGETIFGPETPGVARVAVNGIEFVRAYGTMPHANILAGFLVLGLIALFYLFLREEKLHWRVLETGGIFIALTGLFLTFSRSGWITAAVATLTLLLWEFFADKERRGRVVYLLAVLLATIYLLLAILGWAVSPRAALSSNEGPVSDRWTYNRMGVELIISRPLGVGIGNQLFYSYDAGLFDEYGVNSLGQWQPIHNLYLIMGSEIGILGLISFLVFLVLLLIPNFKFLISNQFSNPKSQIPNAENFYISHLPFAIAATLALLLSGLFDHFLWDLQLGRLMFWAVMGILLGVSSREKKPS